jgi:anti-sigma regulatory factor (Ser/Thr protein kinase)
VTQTYASIAQEVYFRAPEFGVPGPEPYDRAVQSTAGTPQAGRQTLSLPAEMDAVSEARRWALGVTDGLLSVEAASDLRLVISEVVTNSLRHGADGEKIDLAVTPKDSFLCVQVTDDGPGLASTPRAMVPEENGGFGLFLVEQLTRRWGITREGHRTRVWFELDYAPAAA